MLRYYLSIVIDIPRAFRSALEAVTFWGGVALAILSSVWPHVSTLQNAVPISPGAGPIGFALILVYGVLRVNYQRIESRDRKLKTLEALPSLKYEALCRFQDALGQLVRKQLVSASDFEEFERESIAVWQMATADLFPLLHSDEKIVLSDQHAHLAWQPNTDARKSVFAQIKNEVEAMTRRERPATPPSGRS